MTESEARRYGYAYGLSQCVVLLSVFFGYAMWAGGSSPDRAGIFSSGSALVLASTLCQVVVLWIELMTERLKREK